MTRSPASISALARPRHILATATIAALTLTGCGSDTSGGDGSQVGPPGNAGSTASATASAQQAAFADMLDKVAQPCPATGNKVSSQPSDQNTSGPTDERPTGATGDQSAPSGQTPPPDPIEPGAPTGPEAELSDRDMCASVQHEQRIIEALQAVSKPTPDNVREALNRLGYIDERIHGLKQAGRATRFHLDLRENGGRLCEAGRAAGDQTEVTPCTASATGAFTVTDSGSTR
ncbi:hypothetical protein [Streptomyces sp. NPDC060188]|uniref:hypothetical protein n=1 Tax=Streptomyces sp. NPDC060188 TaxID=3347068 RepID=UPI003650ED6E